MSRKKPQSAMAALLDFAQAVVVDPVNQDEKNIETQISSNKNEWNDISLFVKQDEMSIREEQQENLITVSPDNCILWRFSDRPSDELGDIDSLAQSLKEHGQQEPILVRRNRQETSHEYEVIFGNRRWRAAQLAKIKLIAICKDLTDQQASLCQKEENENRKELSDYARAMSYRAQLDGGVFKNETELSKTLGISKQALNDLMAYLRVPEVLREAISNYKTLSKKMVIKLAALSKDSAILEALISMAPKISDQSITTTTLEKHIHSFLMPSERKHKFLPNELEARNSAGQLLFRTRLQKSGEVFVQIARHIVDQHHMEGLHAQFECFLQAYLIKNVSEVKKNIS